MWLLCESSKCQNVLLFLCGRVHLIISVIKIIFNPCVWELNEVNYLAVDTCTVVILSGHCVLPAQERETLFTDYTISMHRKLCWNVVSDDVRMFVSLF